jgi:hypothetical protein
MTTLAQVNFSDLIQKPRATVARLFGTFAGLRLVRRGEPDLYITTADRAEQTAEVVRSNTLMFHSLLKDEGAPQGLLRRALADAHPWVRFLPSRDTDLFLDELIEVSRASVELDTVAAIYQVITEWKHTAEVWADPELATALGPKAAGEDFGPVPMPQGSVE